MLTRHRCGLVVVGDINVTGELIGEEDTGKGKGKSKSKSKSKGKGKSSRDYDSDEDILGGQDLAF